MNFMEVVGVSDSFTPPVSMAAYARSGNMDLLSPVDGVLPAWFDSIGTEQLSYIGSDENASDQKLVSGTIGPNRPVGAPTHTRVSIQHPPCATDADCPGELPSLPKAATFWNADSAQM